MDAGPDIAKRSLVFSRIFDAPRELVFEAFTTAEHLARWWGPNGFTITTEKFEFRVGGKWHLVMHGPDGRDYQNYVTFDEIDRPRKLVFHHDSDEAGLEPMHHGTTVLFEEIGSRTKVTFSLIFTSAEMRDMVVREYKADEGGLQTLGRLAEVLVADQLLITRRIKAPRALVWKAHSELEHLKAWWGPKGLVWLSGSLDFRPGGKFHYGMKTPDGQEMWGRFMYHEIQAPERIAFVNSFSDAQGGITRAPFAPNWPLEVYNEISLVEDGNETIFTLRGGPLNATQEERTKFRSFFGSMQGGFSATYDQLDMYLEKLSG